MKKTLLLCIASMSVFPCLAADRAERKARARAIHAQGANHHMQAVQAANNAQAARMLHHAQMSNRPVVGSIPPMASSQIQGAITKHNRGY